MTVDATFPFDWPPNQGMFLKKPRFIAENKISHPYIEVKEYEISLQELKESNSY